MTADPLAVRRHHFVALDSWRGICAIAVAMGHLKTNGFLSQLAFSSMTYRFVDFFFVLSGFVIAHAARDQLTENWRHVWSFLIRRVGRLWPLHATVLGLFVIYQLVLLGVSRIGIDIGEVAFTDKYSLSYIPANLLLVQAWNTLPSTSWNIPAWSISAEFAAYLLFAFLFTAFHRFGVYLFVLVGLVCGYLITGAYGPRATFDLGVPRCLFGFSTGVLVNAIWRQRPALRLPYPAMVEIAALIVTIVTVTWLPSYYGIFVVPVFAVVIFLYAYEQGVVSRILRGRAGQFVGQRSYSIYMVHMVVSVALLSVAAVAPKLGIQGFRLGEATPGNTGIVGPPAFMDLLIVGYLSATVALATITYALIEVPARNRAGRFAKSISFVQPTVLDTVTL